MKRNSLDRKKIDGTIACSPRRLARAQRRETRRQNRAAFPALEVNELLQVIATSAPTSLEEMESLRLAAFNRVRAKHGRPPVKAMP